MVDQWDQTGVLSNLSVEYLERVIDPLSLYHAGNKRTRSSMQDPVVIQRSIGSSPESSNALSETTVAAAASSYESTNSTMSDPVKSYNKIRRQGSRSSVLAKQTGKSIALSLYNKKLTIGSCRCWHVVLGTPQEALFYPKQCRETYMDQVVCWIL